MKIGDLSISKVYQGAAEIEKIYLGSTVIYEATFRDSLRFKALENSTFGLVSKSSVSSVQYSLDNGNTWTELTTNDNVSLNAGQVALIRGKITGNLSTSNYTKFLMTGNIACKGNIMYLYDYENLTDIITYECAFTLLFESCSSLTSAPELPATTLSHRCYHGMFNGCSSLSTAPVLPATTLATYCYSYMFRNCTSLSSTPELPATTLVGSCYQYMFGACTSLTSAPELPATTLATGCYNNMFSYCSQLNHIKCLATDISATNCTYNWLLNVASTGTFIKNPAMTSWTTGDSGIPSGWTVQ